ncbi:HalOD1 output domain-containing protein [Halobellus captivus]|uniref:HalOD1 output domain-containing protein n=1 Tax=Halobellus captivus TaxID=2592614 RepID=UPI00139676CB|nr:HalOD1 output domain-containing protein [Halobellus captivus]
MTNHSDPQSIDDVDTDRETLVYTREPDESPSNSVIEAVGKLRGTDPTKLPSLYESIDPDAIDDLIDGQAERSLASTDVCVTFQFAGCEVAVYADRRTIVSRPISHR